MPTKKKPAPAKKKCPLCGATTRQHKVEGGYKCEQCRGVHK